MSLLILFLHPLDSNFTVINVVYDQSSVRMFSVYSSRLNVQNLTLNGIVSPTTLFTIYESNYVNIMDLALLQASANSGYLIIIERSKDVTMTRVTAQNSTEIVIHIIDSNITSLMNLNIQK